MTFDNVCNKILTLMNEGYTLTLRDVLYKRYGKDRADNMLAKIKSLESQNPEWSNYLNKNFVLPDYSQENLDKAIPVNIKELDTNVGGSTRSTFTQGGFRAPHISHEISLGSNEPDEMSGIPELRGGMPSYQKPNGDPYDVIGHEATHTAQKFGAGEGGKKSKFTGSSLRGEFAPILGELKRWYFARTGIALDAYMTDQQFEEFMAYCKRYNAFRRLPYGTELSIEKLLNQEEGREAFKRIVKTTSTKSDSMVA